MTWRRPDDIKNIQNDRKIFQNMKTKINHIVAADGELIQVDECVFS